MNKYMILSFFEGEQGYEWYLEPFIIVAKDRYEARKIAKGLIEWKQVMVIQVPNVMKTVNVDGFVD